MKNPGQLKLHREALPAQERPAGEELPPFDRLCGAFEEATGWSICWEASPGGVADRGSGEDSASGALGRFRLTAKVDGGGTPIELYKARRLAASLGEIVGQLQLARDAVWYREAELATGVPVTADDREEQHLAVRLEAVLKGGAQAVGCQAAAVYLLDDATTELKLRASWGLPRQRLFLPPRPLRGAVADLEALIGHAVVLEDTRITPQWRTPEPFASAVCVPVSTPSEPLGTLWVFCDRPRGFSPEQTNLVEIIAGRVAAELQREALLRECVQTKRIDRQLLRAAAWQDDRLPSVPPLFDGWEITGWTDREQVLRGGFYDWFVPPDGRLAATLGTADGSMLEAALTAASVQGVIRAHSAYRHRACQMLRRVNRTVWNGSAGGQSASLFYALIAPRTGAVEWCSAGPIQAWVLRESGPRLLELPHPPLGSPPEGAYAARRLSLGHGDALVVSAGPEIGRKQAAGRERRHRARSLQKRRLGSLEQLAAAVREPVGAGKHLAGPHTVLVVRRK